MEAIGDLLPVAVAAALSPFPVAGVILMLGSPHGRVSGPAFALGWLGGLSLLTLLLILAARGAEAGFHDAGPWLQIVVGIGLLGAAIRKWRQRPREGEPIQPPGWMSAFGEARPGRAMMLGAALGANPKNVALAFGAASSIVAHGLPALNALAAGLVFVAVASSTVIAAVLIHRFGGHSSKEWLGSLEQFMLRNNNVILMIVFVLIGVKILGDGLSELAEI